MKALVLILTLSASAAIAQQHTVAVQPQYGSDKHDDGRAPAINSSHDPFQFDWSSGEFVYLPRPYESFDIHGPYRFNPTSGRFNYMPFSVPPPDYWPPAERGTGNASNYLDTRVGLQSMPAPAPSQALSTAPEPQPPMMQARTVNVPPPPTLPKGSTTKPAEAAAWKAASRAQLKGRWEFNAETGRWRCILPGD
jgi:hypothetical protein